MAHLPDDTITTILNLQRRFLEILDATTALDFAILDRFGETDATISELDQLQSIKDRAISSSYRLYTLSIRIAESQPVASNATLELMAQSITVAQGNADALEVSLLEIRRDYNLS